MHNLRGGGVGHQCPRPDVEVSGQRLDNLKTTTSSMLWVKLKIKQVVGKDLVSYKDTAYIESSFHPLPCPPPPPF